MTTVNYVEHSSPGAFQGLVNSLIAIRKFSERVVGRSQNVIRMWVVRHRDRQELLTLLAQDHRIAADVGKTEQELKAWAHKPFWLPSHSRTEQYQRAKTMAILRRACVFCGSRSGNNPKFIAAALELGRILAESGIGLVYGGGSKGLMGAVARGAHERGGEIIGVIPHYLRTRELEFPLAKEMVITRDMHERKRVMFERADAFIALPGGAGTLEELVEQLAWAQLGHHRKPVLLADINGYWRGLLAVFHSMADAGFVRADAPLSYTVCDNVADIVPTLRVKIAESAERDQTGNLLLLAQT
jgi:uncharacterized protein (TIGR00730 family)